MWSRGSDLGSLGGIPQTIDILPPRCISVRSPVHGMLTFDGIAEDTTVGHLKVMIVERVGLSPARRIHLSWFGRELPDQLTLAQCRVRSSSVLDMRLTLVRLDAFERTSLERVRVLCTCLETQTYAVDRTTTAAELKLKIRSFLTRGEHEWFGKKVRASGQTRHERAPPQPLRTASRTNACASMRPWPCGPAVACLAVAARRLRLGGLSPLASALDPSRGPHAVDPTLSLSRLNTRRASGRQRAARQFSSTPHSRPTRRRGRRASAWERSW